MGPPNTRPDSPSAPSPEEPETGADLPMTMAASVILDHLPRDTHAALQQAGELYHTDGSGRVRDKVKVRLTPLPGVRAMRTPLFNCGATQTFAFVVRFLRKRLGVGEGEAVFCYVNSVFAPGLDEGVGNLWRCFKTGDELVVSYSVAQAFG